MAACEVCGNNYDKPITVSVQGGETRNFDSFECAIHALAPTCAHCGIKVIGHGIESGDDVYCCVYCAREAGIDGAADRV
jgi:hypothetical protein